MICMHVGTAFNGGVTVVATKQSCVRTLFIPVAQVSHMRVPAKCERMATWRPIERHDIAPVGALALRPIFHYLWRTQARQPLDCRLKRIRRYRRILFCFWTSLSLRVRSTVPAGNVRAPQVLWSF